MELNITSSIHGIFAGCKPDRSDLFAGCFTDYFAHCWPNWNAYFTGCLTNKFASRRPDWAFSLPTSLCPLILPPIGRPFSDKFAFCYNNRFGYFFFKQIQYRWITHILSASHKACFAIFKTNKWWLSRMILALYFELKWLCHNYDIEKL